MEQVQAPIDDLTITVGDEVAMHWDYVCLGISEGQRRQLERYQTLHIGLANQAGRHLAKRVES